MLMALLRMGVSMIPGATQIDADAVLAIRVGHVVHEALEAGLGRRIRRAAGPALAA